MTTNDALDGYSVRATELIQKGSLLALAAAATLILIFCRGNILMVGIVLAICTVFAPAIHVTGKRFTSKVRRRETESRLVMHTKAYLQDHEAECTVRMPPESDIEILARVIDGRKLPVADFRSWPPVAAPLPIVEPILFHALPRRYATRTLCERRFANLASALPKPIRMPWQEVVPGVAQHECRVWSGGPETLVIEYSDAVMDEIRLRADEGHQLMRHGGMEVGGVLFGKHAAGVVRIMAARPVACEYAEGPRFLLSKQDEKGLVALLRASSEDPELAGLEPAGWYRSHTQDEICLSDADTQFYNRFFPLAWQVALVVRPADLTPTLAGFFFRELNGVIRTESSYREFSLGPAAAASTAA